ncbi:MAG TPA: hypothetical protein VGJ20_12510 [Xanthobacteraceae bacterium]
MTTTSDRDRHGFRGVPPPPTFSLASLPDDTRLTEEEVAAVLRNAKSTLADKRRRQTKRKAKSISQRSDASDELAAGRTPPLEWTTLPGGFVRYTAGAVREYIAAGAHQRRKDGAATRANANHNPKNSTA